MGIGFIIQHFLDRSNAWKTNSNNGLIEKKGPGFLFFFSFEFQIPVLRSFFSSERRNFMVFKLLIVRFYKSKLVST
jgi:hypothetical protein